jgi:hypothetical protein
MASMRARARLPFAARQTLVDGHQQVSQHARFAMAEALLVHVPEDLDVGIADRRRPCGDPFQHRLDHQVARHRLAQRRRIQAEALEFGVILVIVAVTPADFHQAGVDRGRRQHHAGRFRCLQDQGLDLLLPGGDKGHPVQFFRCERLQRLAEQLRGELDRAVDAARFRHRLAAAIRPARPRVPAGGCLRGSRSASDRRRPGLGFLEIEDFAMTAGRHPDLPVHGQRAQRAHPLANLEAAFDPGLVDADQLFLATADQRPSSRKCTE